MKNGALHPILNWIFELCIGDKNRNLFHFVRGGLIYFFYPPQSMKEFSPGRLGRLSGMLKRRGIILPAFEIHGGYAGLYDFGPVGGRLRNRVNQTWIDHWQSMGNVVEISGQFLYS